MKRVLTIVSALLVAAAPAFAQIEYGWTISSSSSDPFVNQGPIPAAPLPLYLWLFCSQGAPPDAGPGMASAEFDLRLPAGVFNFGFTAMNGFLNAGGAGNLLLAVGGCPQGPVVAGVWNVFGSIAGDYCLVASAANGIIGTVDCSPTVPSIHPLRQVGFGAGVAPSCNDGQLCPPVAVEAQSWGSVKSLYR